MRRAQDYIRRHSQRGMLHVILNVVQDLWKYPRKIPTFVGMTCCVLLLASPIHAQDFRGYDTSLPIEISADQLDVLQQDKLAVFRGKVLAEQGEVKLRSESMTVHYRTADKQREAGAAAVSKIEVDKQVFLATPQESAQGDKGIYDVDRKMIYLLGNVVLTRGQNVLKGSRLQYNLATGRSVVTGGVKTGTGTAGKSGERVRGIFVPKDNKSTDQ